MTDEKLFRRWKADPRGNIVIEIYQEKGIMKAFKAFFQKRKVVDVPGGGFGGLLYEVEEVSLKSNQRIEVYEGDSLITQEYGK